MAVCGAKERIDAALQGWSGITSQPHRFGGTEYCLGRREIGHVHRDSLVDIPFPKTVRNELITGGRAEPHHILPDSGSISIYLRQASDVDKVIELLRLSFEIANQRTTKSGKSAGRAARPPRNQHQLQLLRSRAGANAPFVRRIWRLEGIRTQQ